MDWQLLVGIVVTVGLPAALLSYSVWRMRGVSGPQVELEPHSLVSVLLTFPVTGKALQELEAVVRRADFRAPETRRAAIRTLNAWLALRDRSAGDGRCAVLHSSKARDNNMGRQAERLAQRQTERMDRKPAGGADRSASAGDAPWCVIGIVAAAADSAAGRISPGEGRGPGEAGLAGLAAAAEALAPMQAFYLFFAPAPGERLSRADAAQMVKDLTESGP